MEFPGPHHFPQHPAGLSRTCPTRKSSKEFETGPGKEPGGVEREVPHNSDTGSRGGGQVRNGTVASSRGDVSPERTTSRREKGGVATRRPRVDLEAV